MAQRDAAGGRAEVGPGWRLAAGAVAGGAAALVVRWPSALTALLAGWAIAAGLFALWTWLVIGPMDAERSRSHATREEPTRAASDAVIVLAALASVAGVLGVLSGNRTTGAVATVTTFAAILASWTAVHTVAALHYARIWFADGGGIDFHQTEPPRYTDFAYLALTVGMSFAVSDTDLGSSRMRAYALRQALISYLFGTVLIAMVINEVGSGG